MFKEIEFKYPAENLTLESFKAFCENKKPKNFASVFGADTFYSHKEKDDRFFRHRKQGLSEEITFKIKTVDGNSFIREEYNLDAWAEDNLADAFFGALDFERNTTVNKICTYYKYEWYTLSWYICLDSNFKELGRFIELEINEDYEWGTEKDAWDSLVILEKTCKDIGAATSLRINKSLFEMYRKEKV